MGRSIAEIGIYASDIWFLKDLATQKPPSGGFCITLFDSNDSVFGLAFWSFEYHFIPFFLADERITER